MINHSPHFMIVPSLSCNANCSYCFGPHQGNIMTLSQGEETLQYILKIVEELKLKKVAITFHGGEPLLAGRPFFEKILPNISKLFKDKPLKINLQSNLWELDAQFCELFKYYKVELGTSLDGPKDITNQQRGEGYFEKTTRGITLANSYGLQINAIATFTPWSIQRWKDVFNFFISKELHFSIHPAVSPLDHPSSPHSLSPETYETHLEKMLEYYLKHRHLIQISSFDQLCQSLEQGMGKVCTFSDCLGMFLAFDPNGHIYPCQRFCGNKEYSLGMISQALSFESLLESPIAQRYKQHQNQMKENCSPCEHYSYCKGGCFFNAKTSKQASKDPFCHSYKKTFSYVKKRLHEELAKEENINAIAKSPFAPYPLLRKGPLIEILREGYHPRIKYNTAKLIILSHELAKRPNLSETAKRLTQRGIVATQEEGRSLLNQLKKQISSKTKGPLNNLYLYITHQCQLKCTHCYLYEDGRESMNKEMNSQAIESLLKEAKAIGFRQVIILGGEPLLHSQLDTLLDKMKEIRPWVSPMKLVLRSNFTFSFTQEKLLKIAQAFDQVVVSVDGDKASHEKRRGKGSYDQMVQSLKDYQKIAHRNKKLGTLSLASVLPHAEVNGPKGFSVRKLGKELQIRRIRFRPLLPLGRAKQWESPPLQEAIGSYMEASDLLEYGFSPTSSCGIGQNIYIEATGNAFPCYAYQKPHSLIGNVIEQGLQQVIDSKAFSKLAHHTVDSNSKCKTCDVKYLCGGACRAWGGEKTQYDLDAPPPNCGNLEKRARNLLEEAEQLISSTHKNFAQETK